MKDIHQRLKQFAVEIIKVVQEFPRALGVFRVADQLVGSGTSPAANAREANKARSKPEFISCMGIALKELEETEFWLEIVAELNWVSKNKVASLLKECQELNRILSTIILNTKKNSIK